ncbi:MAG: phosphoribosylanthranilate isomerase [Anaerolineae bacterium]
MIVQIYGVTTAEDAAMVAALGADHVGIAVGQSGQTDEVDLDTAQRIFAAIPAPTRKVALTVSDDLDEIEALARALQPDILHVAAAISNFGAEATYALKSRLPELPVMQTVAVVGPSALYVAVKLNSVADYLLLDTRDPDTGRLGITGLTHDWSVSRRIVETVGIPVILAGGLSPENVADAIRQVGPAGVDSATHTSHADDPRRKDADRVRRFIEAAHATV